METCGGDRAFAYVVGTLVGALVVALLASAGAVVAAQAVASAPVLTDFEKLRIENVNLLDELRKALLEADTCRGVLAKPRNDLNAQQVSQAVDKLRADINAAHPGFVWNSATGALTPTPDPPK